MLLSEIQERLVRIETKMEILPVVQEQVKRHGDEILKFNTSVKVLRWLGGALLISVPATVAAVLKMFRV